MIPSKTIEIQCGGDVDIKATYGDVAVAIEAANGALTFNVLSEYNEQTSTETTSQWATDGIPDGKIIYGRFSKINISGSNAGWIHLK